MKIKISVANVIASLEKKLVAVKEDKANQAINDQKYQKEREKWSAEIVKLALANAKKATDPSASVRYDGTINVSFTLPKGSVELPEEPTKDYNTYNDWQYKEMVEDIEQALRLLAMCEDEFVSASTMKSISKYL